MLGLWRGGMLGLRVLGPYRYRYRTLGGIGRRLHDGET